MIISSLDIETFLMLSILHKVTGFSTCKIKKNTRTDLLINLLFVTLYIILHTATNY